MASEKAPDQVYWQDTVAEQSSHMMLYCKPTQPVEAGLRCGWGVGGVWVGVVDAVQAVMYVCSE